MHREIEGIYFLPSKRYLDGLNDVKLQAHLSFPRFARVTKFLGTIFHPPRSIASFSTDM